jgi:hypothetical protein
MPLRLRERGLGDVEALLKSTEFKIDEMKRILWQQKKDLRGTLAVYSWAQLHQGKKA